MAHTEPESTPPPKGVDAASDGASPAKKAAAPKGDKPLTKKEREAITAEPDVSLDDKRRNARDMIRNYVRDQFKNDTERQKFAVRCGTSLGNLRLIMGGSRNLSAWLAINLDRESRGKLDMREILIQGDDKHRIDWDYVAAALSKRLGKVPMAQIRKQVRSELLEELQGA